MGGGDKEETTSGPSNPMVDSSLTKLLGGLQGTYDSTTAAGTPANLQQGWTQQINAAANPDFARGINGATADFADAAAGNQYGANDPAFAKLSDNTLRDVNAMFTNSGRFGSGSHVETAVNALSDVNNANIAADRQWQSSAAGMLPQMFAAGQAPGSVQASVGEQQRSAPWFNLQNASSVLAGTSGASGTTTTQPATPWWQSAIGLAGQFI